MRTPTLAVAIVLGACAGTAASTIATPDSAPVAKVEATSPLGAVVAAGAHERRVAPPGTASITFLAQGQNAFLGLLEMDGGGRVPEHRDPTEEYLYVLEGSGTLIMDGVEYPVSPGTSIYMPANAKVSYLNDKAALKAVQVFAGPAPAAKYSSWMPAAGQP